MKTKVELVYGLKVPLYLDSKPCIISDVSLYNKAMQAGIQRFKRYRLHATQRKSQLMGADQLGQKKRNLGLVAASLNIDEIEELSQFWFTTKLYTLFAPPYSEDLG